MKSLSTGIYAQDKGKTKITSDDLKFIHPFFGVEVFKKDFKGIDEDTEKAEYTDYAMRESGLGVEIIKNNKILQGLANPSEYLFSKNEALENIGKQLGIAYQDEFVKQINFGKSSEEARKEALHYIKAIKEIKMKAHESEDPTELTREIFSKLGKKVRYDNI